MRRRGSQLVAALLASMALGAPRAVGGAAAAAIARAVSEAQPGAPARSIGIWRIASALRENRTGARCVALAEGRVLITGGYSNPRKQFLRSAEVWDARRLASRATGSMGVPRAGHTATLLPDGRVLIAGGERGGPEESGTEASAELWDPTAGTFTKTGSMHAGRREHVAVRLTDNRVAVAGGTMGAFAPVEIWSAASGVWVVADAAAQSRDPALVTLVASARSDGAFRATARSPAVREAIADLERPGGAGARAIPDPSGSFVELGDGRVFAVAGASALVWTPRDWKPPAR